MGNLLGVSLELAKHYRIDGYLPDAMANKKVLLSQSLENCLDGTEEWLQTLMGHIGEAANRASNPTKQQVADITKFVSMLQDSVVGNPSYSLENLAEFAEEVKAHGQQEVEALMAFHKMNDNEGAR